MIIVFKTNVGTAAYDSDTILNLEYTPSLGLYITYAATNNKLNCVVKTNHHYLKNDKEFDNILEQWKQSKENK